VTLQTASDRFNPVTGVNAISKLARARLTPRHH
jgi:hypothetical protein